MKKLLLLLSVFGTIGTQAQMIECVGDEVAGMGTAGAFPCANLDLLSNIPIAMFDQAYTLTGIPSTTSDSWGWTDEASGREFAIVSYTEGFAYVEITDPINPVITAVVPITATDTQRLWRDVKVYNNHAFMVGEDRDQGMKVLELTQLLDITDTPQILDPDVFFQGFGSAHNIAINEESGYAYPIGCRDFGEGNVQIFGGGPIFINIQDPLNPVIEGHYDATDDGVNAYSHDAQIVIYDGPDQDYIGQEIYMGANEETLVIADVTDKANPIYISDLGYSQSAYTHQGWFTKDKRYFVMGDELDEAMNALTTRMIVYNVEDLDNPSLHFIWEGPTTATDHNIYIIDDTLYLANYTDGVRIFDISDIDNENFVEIGFFDSVPGSSAFLGGGAWNVYPYFPSGNIIMSDLDGGLFVLGPSNNLGVDEVNQNSFEMFPNPAQNEVVLTTEAEAIQSISVTNVLGKQVIAQEELSVTSKTLNTSSLASGVYMVSVNGKTAKKLIIE